MTALRYPLLDSEETHFSDRVTMATAFARSGNTVTCEKSGDDLNDSDAFRSMCDNLHCSPGPFT